MLIINFYTLQTVYALYFTEHIILNRTNTFNFQDVMWIYTTFCQLITSL